MTPLPKSDWAHLIPHQGGMCLLDVVLDWNESTIHASTQSHRRSDNPLCSDGKLRAVHLCEYGAQSMAVHGALLARVHGEKAAPGFLVSLRNVSLNVSRIDDLVEPLHVYGERLLGGDGSWQYAFRIEHAGTEIASGRAAVMLNPILR